MDATKKNAPHTLRPAEVLALLSSFLESYMPIKLKTPPAPPSTPIVGGKKYSDRVRGDNTEKFCIYYFFFFQGIFYILSKADFLALGGRTPPPPDRGHFP